MKVDEYTATKNPNINNFSGHPVIPLNIPYSHYPPKSV